MSAAVPWLNGSTTTVASRSAPGRLAGAHDEPERASHAERRVDADLPSHRFHEPLAEREADAGTVDALRIGLEPLEGQEDSRELIGRDAASGVAHPHDDHPRDLASGERDPATTTVVLDRVREQVEEHLAQADRVGDGHARRFGLGAHLDGDAVRVGERLHQLECFLQRVENRNRSEHDLEPPPFDAFEVEHLFHQLEEVPSGGEDLLDRFLVRRREVVHLQQLRVAEHDVERCTQLVAHARQELALGAIRGDGDGELGFDLAVLRHVAVARDDPTLAVRSFDRVGGHPEPAHGAVVDRNAERLVRGLSGARHDGLGSGVRRNRLAVFVDHHPVGLANRAERVGRRDAEQTRGGRVRGRDPATRVERHDAVDQTLHHHSELLFGAHERREIVDLRDDGRSAGFVGQPADRETAPHLGAVGSQEPQPPSVAHLPDLDAFGRDLGVGVVVGIGEHLEAHTDEIVGVAPQHAAQAAVRPPDATVSGEQRDAGRCVVERLLERTYDHRRPEMSAYVATHHCAWLPEVCPDQQPPNSGRAGLRGCEVAGSFRRVLPVEVAQHGEHGGLVRLECERGVEEGFGGDGEELGG